MEGCVKKWRFVQRHMQAWAYIAQIVQSFTELVQNITGKLHTACMLNGTFSNDLAMHDPNKDFYDMLS